MKRVFFIIIIITLLVCSCRNEVEKGKNKSTSNDIGTTDIDKSKRIPILETLPDPLQVIKPVLNKTDYTITESMLSDIVEIDIDIANPSIKQDYPPTFTVDLSGNLEEHKVAISSLWDYTLYNGTLFYIVAYEEPMALNPYRAEIYSYDSTKHKINLLYECNIEGFFLLNELVASNNRLFWVEVSYTQRGEVSTIRSFDLETKKISDIKVFNGPEDSGMPICLSASDKFLTWYEYDVKADYIRAMIYDISKASLSMLPFDNIICPSPYVRLKIVDEGVTFLTGDDSGTTIINRYDLLNDTRVTLGLPESASIAACMSNNEYFGWFQSYNVGGNIIYLYNYIDNTLYTINGDGKNEIFSHLITSNDLYLNNKTLNCMQKIDLRDLSVSCYDCSADKFYFHFTLEIDESVSIRSVKDGISHFYIFTEN